MTMNWKIDEWRAAQNKKKPRKRPTNHEDKLNIDCVKWFDEHYPQYWTAMFHSPNEGSRSSGQGELLKEKGMRPGMADLVLMLPTEKYNFLAIELKNKGDAKRGIKKGYPSKNEKYWQKRSETADCLYYIIYAKEDFISVIDGYIQQHLEFRNYVRKSNEKKETEE